MVRNYTAPFRASGNLNYQLTALPETRKIHAHETVKTAHEAVTLILQT